MYHRAVSIELRRLRVPPGGGGDDVYLAGSWCRLRLQWRVVKYRAARPLEHPLSGPTEPRVMVHWADVPIVDESEAAIEGRGEQRQAGRGPNTDIRGPSAI